MSVTSTKRLRPGERAPRSGVYDMVDSTGTATGERRHVAAGEPLPPSPASGIRYVLRKVVEPRYTSVASAAAMEETTATFSTALRRLAER